MSRLPWWWPFLAVGIACFALIVVTLVDTHVEKKLLASASVLEMAGAVLLGVPLIKTRTNRSALSTTVAPTTFGSTTVHNEELETDLRRGSIMGVTGLVLLVGGFGIQFATQLFGL